MIRVTVPRPVAEALMPRPCDNRYCDGGIIRREDGRGVGYCQVCYGSGVMPPALNLLVVEGYWPPGFVTDEDHPPAPRYDVARAIESGERIGLDVWCETCGGTGQIEAECWDLTDPNNHLGWVPCDCTNGRVRVGSVRPVRVLPVRLDMYFRDDPGAVVVLSKAMINAGAVRYAASPGAVSTDITDAMSVYGPAESLVGRFAIEVEDARRGE